METEASRVLYTAKVRTQGGRERGTARSPDGALNLWMSLPGRPGSGTNPEQLFAAAWSASFESAIGTAALNRKLRFPIDVIAEAEVELGLVGGLYTVGARLDLSLPNLPRDLARALVDEAQALCPYSRAVHGNIDIRTQLVNR